MNASSLRLFVEALEDRTVPSAYTVTDLGTFGGTESHGYSINEAGQVAGYANTARSDHRAKDGSRLFNELRRCPDRHDKWRQ